MSLDLTTEKESAWDRAANPEPVDPAAATQHGGRRADLLIRLEAAWKG